MALKLGEATERPSLISFELPPEMISVAEIEALISLRLELREHEIADAVKE